MDSAQPQGVDSSRYPRAIAATGHTEPSPRRVRGVLGDRVVFDTMRALYVWEKPYYPWYYVPLEDVDPELLASFGDSAKVHGADSGPDLDGMVAFEWDALDAWFEEEEKLMVHPRSPFSRVDALRSSRTVRVELEGLLLAESSAPVIVFETGLPPRYYVDRGAVAFEYLVPSDTVTGCPYKGWTSQYWSIAVGAALHPDLAWSYDFPTRQLLPIAGLIAFYDEKVDVSIDGIPVRRPQTKFSE